MGHGGWSLSENVCRQAVGKYTNSGQFVEGKTHTDKHSSSNSYTAYCLLLTWQIQVFGRAGEMKSGVPSEKLHMEDMQTPPKEFVLLIIIKGGNQIIRWNYMISSRNVEQKTSLTFQMNKFSECVS